MPLPDLPSSSHAERLAELVAPAVPAFSEFVNRRLESGELSTSGALQSAIDASGVNAPVMAVGGLAVAADPLIANPQAAAGNTCDGSPGVINQADLLTPLVAPPNRPTGGIPAGLV